MMRLSKQAARRTGLQNRRNLPLLAREEANRAILDVAAGLDWRDWSKACIYLAVGVKGEVETRDLISWLFETYAGLDIYVPFVTGVDPSVIKLSPESQLATGRLGIAYPARTMREAILPEFDVIVAPVVAADGQGNRVGMGMGWYDRLFSAQPRAQKIGLAFDECMLPECTIDTGPHDIRLNALITQRGLHRFG